jgi:hypothetical protein
VFARGVLPHPSLSYQSMAGYSTMAKTEKAAAKPHKKKVASKPAKKEASSKESSNNKASDKESATTKPATKKAVAKPLTKKCVMISHLLGVGFSKSKRPYLSVYVSLGLRGMGST